MKKIMSLPISPICHFLFNRRVTAGWWNYSTFLQHNNTDKLWPGSHCCDNTSEGATESSDQWRCFPPWLWLMGDMEEELTTNHVSVLSTPVKLWWMPLFTGSTHPIGQLIHQSPCITPIECFLTLSKLMYLPSFGKV